MMVTEEEWDEMLEWCEAAYQDAGGVSPKLREAHELYKVWTGSVTVRPCDASRPSPLARGDS